MLSIRMMGTSQTTTRQKHRAYSSVSTEIGAAPVKANLQCCSPSAPFAAACTFANGAARKRCEMCGTERALRTAPFMVPEPDSLPEPELLDDQCLVCNRSTQGTSEVLLCDGCDGEVHLRCAGLQERQFQAFLALVASRTPQP